MQLLKAVEPEILANVVLEPSEMCFIQYMPIRMPRSVVRIPRSLQWIFKLLPFVEYGNDDYLYLTVKYLYVTPDNMGNRPGWHSDGFGTGDVNYLWCDSYPTEFCIQDFELSDDCVLSLAEMERQAKDENVKTFGVNTLMRVDNRHVHRVPLTTKPGFRTFVKLTVSKDRYNLKGNAHNYLFDYKWEMHDREVWRNHTSK